MRQELGLGGKKRPGGQCLCLIKPEPHMSLRKMVAPPSLESRRIEISSESEKQFNEEAQTEAVWFQEVVRKPQGSEDLADRAQPSSGFEDAVLVWGECQHRETWRRSGGSDSTF